MKKLLPAFAVLLCTVILSSCGVTNSVTVQAPDSPSEVNKTCFVQFNDGTVKQFSSLKLVTGVLVTPHLLADNKTVLNSKDIMAYQDSRVYAVSSRIITSTKNSKVAVDALPGFAVKVISGKLNVYSRKYYNGGNTVEEFFLQQGNDGFIVAYSKDVLKTMLKEDPKALEFFNSKTKVSPWSKKLIAAVEIYNGGQMITKN
jgi:hypothetical protein